MLKLVLCVVAALMAGSAQAEMQLREFKNFTRLIPANVLRDQRDRCFAHTLCEYRLPDETWPLTPFCGESQCKALRTKNKEGKDVYKLVEAVTDCGPIIDLTKTPGCTNLSEKEDIQLPFPDCCPKYACEEGLAEEDIVYISKFKKAAKGGAETPRSSN